MDVMQMTWDTILTDGRFFGIQSCFRFLVGPGYLNREILKDEIKSHKGYIAKSSICDIVPLAEDSQFEKYLFVRDVIPHSPYALNLPKSFQPVVRSALEILAEQDLRGAIVDLVFNKDDDLVGFMPPAKY